jgi:hypothetical protein
MRLDDALVRHYFDCSMVMRLATVSARGYPSITPLWFVVDDGVLLAGTAAHTVAVRNVRADERVSVLLDAELAGPSSIVLRLWGRATVHDRLPSPAVMARMARKYYLTPRGARVELAHARQWPLRLRYYRQAQGVVLAIEPGSAELVGRPTP